jgi:hypothetical protein
LARLHSPRAVAAVLGLAQALFCTVAIVGVQLGYSVTLSLAMTAVVAAAVTVAVLDGPAWRPAVLAGDQSPASGGGDILSPRGDILSPGSEILSPGQASVVASGSPALASTTAVDHGAESVTFD